MEMAINLTFFNFFVFVFGLIVGSFLNCLIYRMEAKYRGAVSAPVAGVAGEAGEETSPLQSPLRGRSFCPHCKHTLSWPDLIPVFSFLILGGRCRYCGKKISIQYPLVEISTGLLFFLIFNYQFSPQESFWFPTGQAIFNFQNLLTTFYLLLTACFLIIIFVYDLKHYIIPDKVIFPAIAISVLYKLFEVLNFGHWNLFGIWNLEFGILGPFISALVAAGFFLFIVFISKGRWMGVGDIKLAFLMGLFLGFPQIIVALFLAFLFGAIIGIGLVLVKKKTLKSEVPFGPFLVTGTFIALFWGAEIIQWYLDLFNF